MRSPKTITVGDDAHIVPKPDETVGASIARPYDKRFPVLAPGWLIAAPCIVTKTAPSRVRFSLCNHSTGVMEKDRIWPVFSFFTTSAEATFTRDW